jgi:hypothetical protein
MLRLNRIHARRRAPQLLWGRPGHCCISANSAFSHRTNERLLDVTDAEPLDAGLPWKVTEGVGPDVAERIAAFAGKRG